MFILVFYRFLVMYPGLVVGGTTHVAWFGQEWIGRACPSPDLQLVWIQIFFLLDWLPYQG